MTAILGLFTALANIKAITGYVEAFAAAVTEWYVTRQQAQTLSAIADAAAYAAHASNEEERYEAAQRWRDVLSRPRIS